MEWFRIQAKIYADFHGEKIVHAVYSNLSKTTQLYRSILDETSTMLIVTSKETNEILYLNNAAASFAGKEPYTFYGHSCYKYMFGSDKPCPFCHRIDVNNRNLVTVEKTFRGKTYLVRGKIINLEGKDAFVEYIDDISQQKENTRLISARKQELQEILDNVETGIGIVRISNKKVIFEACNDIMSSLMGGVAGREYENVDELSSEQIHPDCLESFKNAGRELKDNLKCEVLFRSRSSKNSPYIWVLLIGKGIREEDGTVKGYLTCVNVNGQTELTRQLSESENSLKAAMSHIDMDYWEYNIAENMPQTNQNYEKGFGNHPILTDYPSTWQDYGGVNSADMEMYTENLKRLKNGEDNIEFECRTRNRAGEMYQWKRIRYSIISKDEKGRPLKAIGTAQNINDLKLLETNFILASRQNGIETWVLDLKSHILTNIGGSFNGQFSENAPENLIEQGIFAPESVPVIRELYKKVYGGAKQASAQVLSRRALEGDFAWLEIIMTAVEDENGYASKVICTGRDISQEKHLQQLYEEEQRYRNEIGTELISSCQMNLTQNTVDALYSEGESYNLDGIVNITDYKSRLMLFLYDISISDEENLRLSPSRLLKAYNEGQRRISASFMAKRKSDGSPVWVEAVCHLINRPHSNDIMAFFYSSDDTDKYIMGQINRFIVKSDYDLAALIFADVGKVKIIFPSESAVENKNIGKYFTYENGLLASAEYRNSNDDILLNKKFALDTVKRQLEIQPSYVIEDDIEGKDGQKRRKRWHYSYTDRKNNIIALVRIDIEDIIQQKRIKQDLLSQAVREAYRANAAKSDFLANMSHEMRTPLNGVLGIIELAKDENNMEVLKDYLDKIETSGKYLRNLINDILDMSKIESGEIQLHCEAYCFSDFMDSLEAVAIPLCKQKQITFNTEFSKYHHPIYIDKNKFNQIIFNILSNAIKYTPAGGTITVGYKNRLKSNMLIMDIYVRDNGIGMSEEFQKHIFEPFTQENRLAADDAQGTGLGMGISKAYIELMGGTISVESAIGQGTTVFLKLSAPIAKNFEAAESTAAAPSVDLRGKNILIAEDHPLNLLIATKMLEKNGAKVISCENGERALEIYTNSDEGDIDLILMDIRMPKLNGLEASRQIRALGRQDAKTVPIIAMTANAYDEDRYASKLAGMNYHLSKPIDYKTLYNVIDRLLNQKPTKNI